MCPIIADGLHARKLQEIEHQRETSRDLLAGEKRRIVEMLEQECAKTINTAETELLGILEETMASAVAIKMIEETLHKRLAEAIPVLFETTLTRVSNIVNQRIIEVLSIHQEKANALSDTIRRTAAELFEIPFVPGKADENILTKHKPYWVTENWSVSVSPLPHDFTERFLPRNIAIRRMRRSKERDIESIILRNVGNLQFETHQNIEDTFGRFASNLDLQLEAVAMATSGAIQEAYFQRTQKVDSVNQELTKIADSESKIQQLYDGLPKLIA